MTAFLSPTSKQQEEQEQQQQQQQQPPEPGEVSRQRQLVVGGSVAAITTTTIAAITEQEQQQQMLVHPNHHDSSNSRSNNNNDSSSNNKRHDQQGVRTSGGRHPTAAVDRDRSTADVRGSDSVVDLSISKKKEHKLHEGKDPDQEEKSTRNEERILLCSVCQSERAAVLVPMPIRPPSSSSNNNHVVTIRRQQAFCLLHYYTTSAVQQQAQLHSACAGATSPQHRHVDDDETDHRRGRNSKNMRTSLTASIAGHASKAIKTTRNTTHPAAPAATAVSGVVGAGAATAAVVVHDSIVQEQLPWMQQQFAMAYNQLRQKIAEAAARSLQSTITTTQNSDPLGAMLSMPLSIKNRNKRPLHHQDAPSRRQRLLLAQSNTMEMTADDDADSGGFVRSIPIPARIVHIQQQEKLRQEQLERRMMIRTTATARTTTTTANNQVSQRRKPTRKSIWNVDLDRKDEDNGKTKIPKKNLNAMASSSASQLDHHDYSCSTCGPQGQVKVLRTVSRRNEDLTKGETWGSKDRESGQVRIQLQCQTCGKVWYEEE